MTNRSFAIGACHMNAFEFRLRITEKGTKFSSIGKIGFISGSTYPAKHGQTAKQIVNGLLIVHAPQMYEKAFL